MCSASPSHRERAFDKDDQSAFSELSGDYNPVHLDEIAARRTTFGRPIVHGVHIVLWMLDWYAGTSPSLRPFRKISVRFNRALFLDEVATIESRQNSAGIELLCISDGALITHMKLSDPTTIAFGTWHPKTLSWSTKPEELEIDSIAGRRGELALPYQEDDIARHFPAATKMYGTASIAHLLGLTRIVGMEIPGLHSLFGAFSIEIHGGNGNSLNFAASRINRKTSYVQLAFSSDVLTGTADTFVRPRSAIANYSVVAKEVLPREFAGRRSLIIGGSRGLGLVCAYILGAGGAHVVITYKVGRAEAEEGLNAIREAGGNATAIALDVASPAAGFAALNELEFNPTEIYYFATPHIFERKKAFFERAIFDRFVKCYVTDLASIMDLCEAKFPGNLLVFFPSSDALNNPVKELIEYSAAKAAGEAFCEMRSRFNVRIKILKARLPRLETDQTATLLKVETADSAQVMLHICREMGLPAAERG